MSTTTRWRYVGPYQPKPFFVPLVNAWCRHPDADVDVPDHIETDAPAAIAQLTDSPAWERVKARRPKADKAEPVTNPTNIQED